MRVGLGLMTVLLRQLWLLLLTRGDDIYYFSAITTPRTNWRYIVSRH